MTYLPRIRIHSPRSGVLISREGLSIHFYFSTVHREIAKTIRQSLDAYIFAMGSEVLTWYPDDNGDLWELDDKGWKVIQHKLRDEGGGGLELLDNPDAVSGYQFEYLGRPVLEPFSPQDVCAVSFWLPTEYLEEHGPRHVDELVMKLGAALPFTSGHAGFAMHRLGRTPGLQALCSRYPGMDVTDMGHLSWNLGTRINGVHWMNFLGTPVLGALGGADGLRARLSAPGVTVRELGADRAVVVLGEAPEAGDTEQGHLLPAYRELARVLEPWLYHEAYPQDEFTPEELLRWERRFLE